MVLPVRNGPDLEDVPESVRNEVTFHLAETVDDVLTAALADDTAAAGPAMGEPAPGQGSPLAA